MSQALLAPGLFTSAVVQTAALIGGIVAVVTATVGVFTLMRSQAFASEALGDIGAAGGSGSYLAGVSTVWGFLVSVLAGAVAIGLLQRDEPRQRELATGIVLGAGFGLTALLLALATTHAGAAGATVNVLFGSIFTLSDSELPSVLALAGVLVTLLSALYRPLLISSVSAELARVAGIPIRLVELAHLLALALALTLAALTLGAVLSTALLIGPAATARRFSSSPGRCLLTAAAIGLGCTWGGVALSYDSYYWPPLHHGWPASFMIVALVLISYLASGPLAGRSRTHTASA